MSEQKTIPVAIEAIPTRDRQAVMVLVRAKEAIGMDELIASLRGWCDETEKKLTELRMKSKLITPPGLVK